MHARHTLTELPGGGRSTARQGYYLTHYANNEVEVIGYAPEQSAQILLSWPQNLFRFFYKMALVAFVCL